MSRRILAPALALLACTPNNKPAELDAPPPLPDPAAAYGEAPPPKYLPRQTLRPSDRDQGRAPVSLTASDGTGLKLVSFTARAIVEEPLAFTEIRLVFENPNDRRIEGRFEIDLPPNSAISRFAMKISGAWMEGEVVERRAAQVAYEDALHRKQDPALLENKAGNSFSARVFPIQPRERKELIVSYSQELPSSAEPYRLMLRGLPKLDELDASVILKESAPPPSGVTTSIATNSGAQRIIELKKQNWTPDQDLEVLDERGLSITALRHENLALARVALTGETTAAPIGAVTVLFDTSASRALGFANQIEHLKQTLEAMRKPLSEDFELRLVAFDQTTREIFRGKVSALTKQHWDDLLARGAMGASDLERALKSVADHPTDRVLIFSDGVATAGGSDHNDLRLAAQSLVPKGVDRIDAVIDGGIQDAEVLRQVTSADLPQRGIVLDARLPLATTAHKLTQSTLPDVKVIVPGAAWVWPDTLTGLQPGDEALVYADLPATAAMRVILEGDDRIDTTVPTTGVERPLLERAWVGARIKRLTGLRSAAPPSDSDTRNAYASQIVGLSTKFRVLSDFTALLVLETENDYRRFGIDRNALSDILTVDATGISLLQRKATTLPPPSDFVALESNMRRDSREVAAPGSANAFTAEGNADNDVWGSLTGTEIGEAYGVGGLGLVGTGRGGGGTGEGTIGLGDTGIMGSRGGGGSGTGYGRGAGAGFGGRGTRVPTVRQGKADVQGALDKDIIRRIIRAHINEVRYCYNQALARDPSAKGRVAVQFTIGGTGRVPSAVVQETTMKDPAVGTCIAQAVRRWKFPNPEGGGSVIVTYPFILEPGEGSSAEDRATLREIAAEERRARAEQRRFEREEAAEERREAAAEARRRKLPPLTGEMQEIAQLLAAKKTDAALTKAHAWRTRDPGDVLALLSLGDIYEATGEPEQAARAYGSIIDLFPSRADLRRYAGARLERLGEPGLPLAVDTFRRAADQRPDHPQSHRMAAYALARVGRHADALTAILRGIDQDYPSGRFRGVDVILREDASILGAAWIAADPKAEATVKNLLSAKTIAPADKPSLRFILNWETDANDVDFHITDRTGERAFYSDRDLESGGELYADVTTGYGPECFAIPGTPTAFPYQLQAHYYARGPMGYGMGNLAIVQHDGKGHLKFEQRPFVIMQDNAFVDLGKVTGPL